MFSFYFATDDIIKIIMAYSSYQGYLHYQPKLIAQNSKNVHCLSEVLSKLLAVILLRISNLGFALIVIWLCGFCVFSLEIVVGCSL